MVEKGIYLLVGYKDNKSPGEVIWPCSNPGLPGCQGYFKDYNDVEKFIKEYLGLKFNRIIVCKVIDEVEPKLVKTSERIYNPGMLSSGMVSIC